MARKLTDAEVDRLRELWTEGWSAIDLAAEFDVSRQHVGRLVREEQQPAVARLDPEALRSGVAFAVDVFLTGVALGPGTRFWRQPRGPLPCRSTRALRLRRLRQLRLSRVCPKNWSPCSTACAPRYGAPTRSTS